MEEKRVVQHVHHPERAHEHSKIIAMGHQPGINPIVLHNRALSAMLLVFPYSLETKLEVFRNRQTELLCDFSGKPAEIESQL